MKRQHGYYIIAAAAVLVLTGFSSSAFAGTIPDRKANQQQRIAQGVQRGQLTPREAAHLEYQEARLNRETRAMRCAHGGRLTPYDRAVIRHQQNHLSRDIYREKHDDQERWSGGKGF